jgi:hypothetical protein
MVKLDRKTSKDYEPPQQDDLQDEVHAGRLQLRHEWLGRERWQHERRSWLR